jgi:antitoxin component of MazEF toxin-antitoxin module
MWRRVRVCTWSCYDRVDRWGGNHVGRVGVRFASGIELTEEEKLEFKVDSEARIVIESLSRTDRNDLVDDSTENKKRLETITNALNGDEKLGQELLRLRSRRVVRDALLSNVVSGKAVPTAEASFDLLAKPTSLPVALSLTTLDPATRRFLIEDHFQQDLAKLVRDSGDSTNSVGDSSELDEMSAVLISEARHVIAEESDLLYSAEYSIQNGTLVDVESVNHKRIQQKLFLLSEGRLVRLRAANDNVSLLDAVSKYNEYVENRDADRIREFSIMAGSNDRLKVDGDFRGRPGILRIIKSWFSEAFEELAHDVQASSRSTGNETTIAAGQKTQPNRRNLCPSELRPRQNPLPSPSLCLTPVGLGNLIAKPMRFHHIDRDMIAFEMRARAISNWPILAVAVSQ